MIKPRIRFQIIIPNLTSPIQFMDGEVGFGEGREGAEEELTQHHSIFCGWL